MYSKDLKRERIIKKPEYESPEDRDQSLPLDPEPYHVFTLGLLFFQIMKGDPEDIPSSIFERLPAGVDYEKQLTKDVTSLQLGSLIEEMLAWQPNDRPLLEHILSVLRENLQQVH